MDSAANFVSSFGYNFGFQLMARMCSFGINFFLLRTVDKEVLGVANVRLTLLYTTVLFLAREPIRKSCIATESVETSSGDAKKSKFRQNRLIQLLWLCPVLCFTIGLFLSFVWLYCLSLPDASKMPEYKCAVLLFWLSAFIETLAEPLWVIFQQLQLVKIVAVLQGILVLSQRLFVAVLILWSPSMNLTAFSLSMVFSSTIYVLLFYLWFGRILRNKNIDIPYNSLWDILPKRSVCCDWERWSLAVSFMRHSIIKQLLTDGAQYVMTFFDVLDFGQQGIYDAIEKLGSLVARILLAPLEESAYVYFSQNIKRDSPAVDQDQSKFKVATQVLYGLLRTTSVVGMIVCVFGCAYSYLALAIYGGSLLSSGSGPNMLRLYCVYVLLLALNGITECFSFAAMKKEQVNQHQHFLFLFSVVYLIAHVCFSWWLGGAGFILANSINMIARIVYSLWFIKNFYGSIPDERPLNQLIPNLYVSGALIISFLFTLLSELLFCCDGLFNSLTHVLLGIVAFFATCITVYSTDFQLVQFVEKFLLHKKSE